MHFHQLPNILNCPFPFFTNPSSRFVYFLYHERPSYHTNDATSSQVHRLLSRQDPKQRAPKLQSGPPSRCFPCRSYAWRCATSAIAVRIHFSLRSTPARLSQYLCRASSPSSTSLPPLKQLHLLQPAPLRSYFGLWMGLPRPRVPSSIPTIKKSTSHSITFSESMLPEARTRYSASLHMKWCTVSSTMRSERALEYLESRFLAGLVQRLNEKLRIEKYEEKRFGRSSAVGLLSSSGAIIRRLWRARMKRWKRAWLWRRKMLLDWMVSQRRWMSENDKLLVILAH